SFAATIFKPAPSKRRRMSPMAFFFTASGLTIDRVRSFIGLLSHGRSSVTVRSEGVNEGRSSQRTLPGVLTSATAPPPRVGTRGLAHCERPPPVTELHGRYVHGQDRSAGAVQQCLVFA